jgi:xanthine dehydrogenase accessory factor
MREVLADIDRWRSEGRPVALATVVETWGSSPRRVGAKMALTEGHRMAGSVSGGCVEGAVVEAGDAVLKSGRPRLLHFGVADETAWAVGLSCGGSIDVFVEPLDTKFYEELRARLGADEPLAVATVLSGPEPAVGRKLLVREGGPDFGSIGGALDVAVAAAARAALAQGRSQRTALDEPERAEVFVDVVRSSPTLVVVGGVHIAVALTTIAKAMGYRTVVVDPRRPFGTGERFPHADRIVNAWPEEGLGDVGLTSDAAVAVLTHDPKVDDPALRAALPSPAFYVGALGSKTTQAKRRVRLLEAGLTEEQIARMRAPIGLDLGGRSPEEIALAVMAQIVAVRNGRGDAPR